ncbi:MAG: hypothetical protein V1913_03315 [Fibrobacterota bacterium]
MTKFSKTLAILAVTGLALTGCGKNPFGPGAPGGLSIFAKLGKAMSKPSAVNDEENGKEGSKNTVNTAIATAKRLAKGFGTQAAPSWLVSNGIEVRGGDSLVYFEVVRDKPDESDNQKLTTGRGEVAFKYTGTYTNLPSLNPMLISDVYHWKFTGREKKSWNSEVCSLRATVNFSQGNILVPSTIKPGFTEFWARNISSSVELGEGDTAFFTLDSLDDNNHIQYGSGAFYDAHSGKDNSEGPKSFDFDLAVIHKNSQNPSLPYLRYEDNEGIMSFTYPWGETGDSLYFMIHFKPNYERSGEIRKNTADGALLVEFTNNDKTGAGTTTYYNEKREVIGTN